MEAVAAAISHAQSRPEVDPARIGLVGFSLGAYLAMSVAAQDPRVGAVVECFGGMPDRIAENLQRLPPTLILHGDADAVVPVSEAYKLEDLLRARGVEYEIRIYRGVGHAFTGAAAVDSITRTAGFLRRHLRSGT